MCAVLQVEGVVPSKEFEDYNRIGDEGFKVYAI